MAWGELPRGSPQTDPSRYSDHPPNIRARTNTSTAGTPNYCTHDDPHAYHRPNCTPNIHTHTNTNTSTASTPNSRTHHDPDASRYSGRPPNIRARTNTSTAGTPNYCTHDDPHAYHRPNCTPNIHTHTNANPPITSTPNYRTHNDPHAYHRPNCTPNIHAHTNTNPSDTRTGIRSAGPCANVSARVDSQRYRRATFHRTSDTHSNTSIDGHAVPQNHPHRCRAHARIISDHNPNAGLYRCAHDRTNTFSVASHCHTNTSPPTPRPDHPQRDLSILRSRRNPGLVL